MYILNLIRERTSENLTITDTFFVNDFVVDAEKALRNAVAEYLNTKEGKRAIELTCNDFNWGDAIMGVPDKIWFKHGLSMDNEKVVIVKVNQDEILFEEVINVDE